MHHWWTWHQQHKDADCGLQVSGGGGGGRVRGNWFLGKLKHRKIELISFGTPPLKGGARPMSDIIKTKKNIFDLLRRQITWNWSQWIWFRDHWVVALKKHYSVKILSSAKEFVFPHNFWEFFSSPTVAVTHFVCLFFGTIFLSHRFFCQTIDFVKKNSVYGRQRISWPMRIVSSIPKNPTNSLLILVVLRPDPKMPKKCFTKMLKM